jgi:hypothetical protein
VAGRASALAVSVTWNEEHQQWRFQSRGRKSISSGGFSHVAGRASAVAVSVRWQEEHQQWRFLCLHTFRACNVEVQDVTLYSGFRYFDFQILIKLVLDNLPSIFLYYISSKFKHVPLTSLQASTHPVIRLPTPSIHPSIRFPPSSLLDVSQEV